MQCCLPHPPSLKITSSQPFAILLPATPNILDKLQEQTHSFQERQIVLFDPSQNLTSPRQVFLVSLGSPVHFSDSMPDVQIKAPTRLVEIAVDIHISVLDTNNQIGVERDLRLAFRQIMSQKLGEALQQAYSVKREGTTISGLIKVPIDSLEAILKKSGTHGFYFRQKLRGNSEPAFRLALIHQTDLRDENFNRSIDIAKEMPHFYGTHRTNKGSLSLRFSAAGIKDARQSLCKEGMFNEHNIHLVPTMFFQVQGLPVGTNPSELVESLRQWGWTAMALAIKSWPLSPSTLTFLVGSDCDAPGEYICLPDSIVTIVRDLGFQHPGPPKAKHDILQTADP